VPASNRSTNALTELAGTRLPSHSDINNFEYIADAV
jgi:hypothetical protein